jgi:death-on-curing protein
MTPTPRWLPAPAVRALRERLLAEHRGVAAAVDHAGLAVALARPRELAADGAHDVHRIAAAHAFGVARDRPFGGGDGAMALALAAAFLALNGWRLTAPETEAVATTRALAERELDEGGYADWLRGACEPAPGPRG